MKYWCFCIVCLLLTTACESGFDVENFDEASFKEDRLGCSGARLAQKERLIEVSSQFKGYSQTEIRATLGKPDRQDLSDRNQKYFVYFIEPAPQCDSTASANPMTMYIRFSAVNRSTEISFQNY